MSQQIQQRKEQPTLKQLLEGLRPQIAQALPKHISPDRIARIALTALGVNPTLGECTPNSFLGAVMQASQLGLEVNSPLGQAYLVPFRDNKNDITVCTLIVGYQGMMDLARRSGMVKAIYAHAVYDGDDFDYGYGLEPYLKHKPQQGKKDMAALTHVYAVARLVDGEPVFSVLTRDEVEVYRKRSRAANSGPWVSDYEAMCLKTAVRRLYRWLPKSAEQARASALDEPEVGHNQLADFDPAIAGVFEEAPEPAKPALDRIVDLKAAAARTRKGKEPAKEAEPTFDPIDSKQTGGEHRAAAEAYAQKPAKGDITASELCIVLGLYDAAWKTPASKELILSWTAEQRRAAYIYASGGSDKPEFMLGGPIERQPGDDG